MHRIDGDGYAAGNFFTEGNAALSVPATEVTADWANDVQENLCGLVEYAGITLTKGNYGQVTTAILDIIRRGGRQTPVIQALANNQAAPADVTSFPNFLTTLSVAVEFLYSIIRRTDSGNAVETGRAFLTWNSETQTWSVTRLATGDDPSPNVEFSVASTGTANTFKLQYTTDNLAGSSYAGTLRITDIKFVRLA